MGTRYILPGHAVSNYGTRSVEDKLPTSYRSYGNLKTVEIVFSYDDLPTYSATDETVTTIPAGSFIERARIRTITPFVGGTSYNFGLYTPAGVAISAAGIDSAVATAALDTAGETVLCDGTLVGGVAGIGTADGQVVVAATGTYTAGKASLVIEYRTNDDRA